MTGVEYIRLAYVGVFALTAVACFGVVPRARSRIEDSETRWGLTTLLILSGAWASFHVGRLVAPASELKIAFYLLGLVVGLATVGAWLYFCSAYASESYHRQRPFRVAALAVFLTIVSVKLTSPVHGLYFTTAYVTAPFPHLDIRFGVAHWIVTGLAYALSAVGFYILFDLFQESGYATTRLGFLVGLAGLPVLFDVIGYLDPGVFLTFNYEPIGVGLFAVGVLYVADGTFLGVRAFGREQLIDELDEAIVLLDNEGIVRDTNTAATRLFPALDGAIGEPLDAVVPEVADYLPLDDPTRISRGDGSTKRYYLLSAPQLKAGRTRLGQALVFTDVTQFESQRRQIQRQQSRLDDLAEAITHELRNALNVTQGNIDLARTRLKAGEDRSSEESLTTASEMTERMTTLVSDLVTLAQFGQRVEEFSRVDIEQVATNAFTAVPSEGAELHVDAGTIDADPVRTERLFEKLFNFAISNCATRIEISRNREVLSVTDDGRPIASDDIEAAFTYGQAVPDAETGMLLPVARTLVEAHGWEVTIDPTHEGGVRIVVTT